MKKILVLLGHPNHASFNGALADAYVAAARQAGHEVRQINIGELKFDPILHRGYNEIQELEPDLRQVQEQIKWAEHLVVVFPTWWFSPPAILKGFFDRALLPGFGFKYRASSPLPEQLLKGRSLRLICTADAAPFLYQLLGGNPGIRQVKMTFGFCGVRPARVTTLGSIKRSATAKRQRWLANVAKLGAAGS
ncbi:MAG: NAD(P)H-dependent oxidoreductase [Patescibacteria group bacterium]